MTPKFKIGDKVISLESKAISTIIEISISKSGNCYYLDTILGRFEESELTLYTEPKPKVKKWFYLIKWHSGDETMSVRPYVNEDVAKLECNNPKSVQRLDWSMTEVPDDSKD